MMAQAEARGSVAAAKRSDTADRDIVVSAQRRSSTMADVPVAVAVAAAPAVDRARDNSSEIIVTGAKMAAPKRAPRGDWNACTVDDPSQSLSRCTRLVTQGNRKTRERAETHLADGLVQAWQGDTDAAVANFDKAIAAAPQLSIGYLNRGLVYDRKGDIDRAIADLDLAVRYAPDAARAYYVRSRLLRKNGDDDKASADEKRAIELDRRYQDVIE
jgi:tetratricopeptide (TPR) repeat protein